MKKLTLCLALAGSTGVFGQLGQGNLTGNVESTFQFLNEDPLIGASQPDQKGLLNSYMNVFYTNGNFRAGMRFESYLPRIQGYPSNFNGTGIGMRYVGYTNDFVDITVGSIYEQFGSGLSLRAYEDRALGYDNMLDGARIIVRPKKGFVIKGVYGYQRESFDEGRIIHSPGIVRGFDGEIHLNETFKELAESKLDVTIGGSFVSKFQDDDDPVLTLPENVGCYGGRVKLRYGKFAFDAEYVRKEQDPSRDNDTIFNYGHAAVANLSYTQKGLGILVSAKSSDNMSFRSNRSQVLQTALINYLPAMTKTHTYNLVASLYPYPTQLVGEMAYQAEVLYTFKKGSKLGGKYGTSINANFSTAYRPMRHTSGINPLDSTGVTYRTGLFDMSDSLYWRDINFNITKKFSKNFNAVFSYFNIKLNNDVATVAKEKGFIHSNIFVVELGYKFKNKSSLRTEFQALFVNRRDTLINVLTGEQYTKDYPFYSGRGHYVDKGDWATIVVEYTINSNWFVSIMNQYNYTGEKPPSGFLFSSKNDDEIEPGKHYRQPYVYFTAGYIRGATRITASYGKQRAGLFCVGGVCRPVPSSNGLTLTFTHSF